MTLSSKGKHLRYMNYSHICNIPCFKNVRIDTKIMSVHDVYNQRYGKLQMCLTYISKVNKQGQVTDFGFYEILDIVDVRIDTKIMSAACIQPEL